MNGSDAPIDSSGGLIAAVARIAQRLGAVERSIGSRQAVAGGTSTVTTNGSGVATVTHGLPFTPSGIVPAISGTANAWLILVDDPNTTATTFRVVVRTGAGALVTSTSVSFNWIAFS